jgi:hypothetical protein
MKGKSLAACLANVTDAQLREMGRQAEAVDAARVQFLRRKFSHLLGTKKKEK